MRSKGEGDFESSVYQLIQLLKKILKTYPDQMKSSKFKPLLSEQGLNVNFFLFNILPLSEEEWDELEEIYERFMNEDASIEDLEMDLNAEDLDFLRKHGIRF